jgi:hypothetical protein
MNEPIERQETFHLNNGIGRIEVRTDGREACALFVDGQARALDWWENSGSILHDLMIPKSEYSPEWEASFRQVVERGVDPDRSLADQFSTILRLFSSGTYSLTLAPINDKDEWAEIADWLYWHPSWYYPNDAYKGKTFVSTLPETGLDDDRILEFAYQIEAGARPIIITASAANSSKVAPGSWIEFVLDGHHKSIGYFFAKVQPWRLLIEAADPKPLTYEDWPLPKDTVPRSWQIQFGRNKNGEVIET